MMDKIENDPAEQISEAGLTADERDFLFRKDLAAHNAKDWGELRDVSAADVQRLIQIAYRLHHAVHELRNKA